MANLPGQYNNSAAVSALWQSYVGRTQGIIKCPRVDAPVVGKNLAKVLPQDGTRIAGLGT
ncbi:MAG: hypothetical protein KGL39_35195 [Patescibacteria group bacterium]|nr:hypothetical protein [Patescibacteria group bacterium]